VAATRVQRCLARALQLRDGGDKSRDDGRARERMKQDRTGRRCRNLDDDAADAAAAAAAVAVAAASHSGKFCSR
jgi:hypothetical protein